MITSFKTTLLKVSTIIIVCFSHFVVISQNDVWIDKTESENYVARHECSFVQAGDVFIMFGGREQAQQLDVYDFETNRWSQGGNAPKEFNHFQATFYEGFIWVIGSFKTNTYPNELPADYIWLYFPPSKTWIQGPEIPKERRRGGAGLALHNDKFYLVGGNTKGHNGGYVNWFDVYNPKTNTWSILENAPNARDHFSCVVANNKIYALGGRHSGGEGGVFKPLIADVDVYNFETQHWSNLNNPLPTPRAAPSVALFNNELFVMGGEGTKKGPAYKLVEAYSLNTQIWSQKVNMNYARHGTQAIVSGDGIHIAGGSPTRGGGRQHNMEVYNVDNPKGAPIIPSKLKHPKTKCISANKEEIITIKNKGGNSGCFINSMTIEGEDADKFQLIDDYNLKLIRSKEGVELKIKHLGKTKKDVARIVITYNGGLKTSIPLTSK